MWLTLRAMALVLFVSVCAGAQTRTLAVYTADSPHRLESDSIQIMRAEVQRLLAPAGLDVVWKKTTDRRSGEDFELLVVASFDGACSAGPVKVPPVAVSLADTSITDGRILPFFRVDCTRLVQLLGSQADPSMIGRALGRVIAHEIYHIVARTTEHHDNGVAKAVFSAKDLLSARFEFDAWSVARMQPQPQSIASRASDSAQETGR
jgi:hypothetical protein